MNAKCRPTAIRSNILLLGWIALPLVLGAGCPGEFAGLGPLGITSVPMEITLPDGDVTVPVQLINNLIYVTITLNETESYVFVLDTASGLTIISPDVADQFPDNFLNKSAQISGPTGIIDVPLCQIDSLQIGSVDFKSFAAAVEDVTHLFPDLPFTVHGIIGISLFHPVNLTLNYPASEIRIQQTTLPEIDNCYILPIAGGDLVAWSSYDLPKLAIEVGEQTVSCPIDSGNNGFLLLPSTFEDLDFVAPPRQINSLTINGPITFLQGRFDGSVIFGCVAYNQPPVAVGGSLASLGAAAMMPFIVTIDQLSKRVRFESPESADDLIGSPAL